MDPVSLLSQQTQAFSSPALRQITLDVQRVNGINLGQGVCNLPVPDFVLERAAIAVQNGINRYTNPRGLESLRQALAQKLLAFNNINADPELEILVTCGATGGFEAVCATLLNPGDEVVIFEPSYPYHVTALRRYQANIKFVTLRAPEWQLDLDELRDAVTDRTKFLLINTPGNPTGKVFTEAELKSVAEVLEGTSCLLVTDEIYEYMTFDGSRHLSPAAISELRDRTITIGGYSKTFSITGWRIGFMIVPSDLAPALTAFLDAVYVCAPAPLQQAVADGINLYDPTFYESLRAKYEQKRDLFYRGLQDLGLAPLLPRGAYYMICSYESRFPELSSHDFVSRMIQHSGVGAVPSSDFVRDDKQAKWVRFCLASEDEVLEEALKRLAKLN